MYKRQQQAGNVVASIDDLPRARVGYLLNASSKRYFDENGIVVSGYDSVDAGFEAVASETIDAFVHDQPLLQYLANQSDENYLVLPDRFVPQSYAIAVAQDSSLRETINVALLEILASEDWTAIKKRYLGS